MKNQKKKVKLGVVGCGVVAAAYYLPSILRMETAELTAVCDINMERTAACKRLFGAKEAYQDYHEMIRKADIEAVLILTGPGTHFKFTLEAISANKHVLLQKPMALEFEEAKAIATATRKTNLKVLIEPSDNTLLNKALVPVRQLIDKGVLGNPYWFQFFDARPEADHPSLGGNPYGSDAFYTKDSGGELFDFPYAPNLIVSLLGPCKSVMGLAHLSVPDRYIVPDSGYDQYLSQATDPMNANYWGTVVGLPRSEHIHMAAPDNVFSIYEMENGFTGVFHVGRLFMPTLPGTGSGGLQIFGSDGNLIIGNGGHLASFISRRKDLLPSFDNNGWYHIPPVGDVSNAKWPYPVPGGFNYYQESTRHFVKCILEDRDPLVNVEWGLHITEMMTGAMVSSRSGQRYEMTTTIPDPVF
jgi:predicted dehydrogenase